MGGRIAALVLGRRSRWVVIGAWVVLALVLAPLQPKLQTIASDESQTFFARGTDSQRVDHLLDTQNGTRRGAGTFGQSGHGAAAMSPASSTPPPSSVIIILAGDHCRQR